jgi:plasmid stabilization system protein ParE
MENPVIFFNSTLKAFVRFLGPIVVCALFVTHSATAAQIAGPSLSSDQIRKLRDAGEQPETRFKIVVESYDVDDNGVAAELGDRRDIILGIGPNYFHVTTDNILKIYDFDLSRVFTVDLGARAFSNTSMYAMVAFRGAEANNRQRMAQISAEVGLPTSPTNSDPFWRASELGIAVGDDKNVSLQVSKTAEGHTDFIYEGDTVARLGPETYAIGQRAKRLFNRFLRHEMNLHPAYVERLASIQLLPNGITFRRYERLDKFREIRVRIGAPVRVVWDFPLEPGLRSEPSMYLNDPLTRRILPTIISATAGHRGNGPPSPQQFIDAMRHHLENGPILDAFLVFLEVNLYMPEALQCPSTSNDDCRIAAAVIARVRDNPSLMKIYASIGYQSSGIGISDAISTLVRTPREGLTHGYMLSLYQANALSDLARHMEARDLNESKRLEELALTSFADALRGNPYIGSFYKDIGNHYFKRFNTPLAWLYWDLGRQLPVRSTFDKLNDIDKFEAKLRQINPEFF